MKIRIIIFIIFYSYKTFACELNCTENKVAAENAVSLTRMLEYDDYSTQRESACKQSKQLNPAQAARKLMAITYGSCDALKIPVVRKEQVAALTTSTIFLDQSGRNHSDRYGNYLIATQTKNHPYLAPLNNATCAIKSKCEANPTSCAARTCEAFKNPSMYQYGEKAKANELVHSHTKSKIKMTGYDCSGFIASAFEMNGWKLSPKQDFETRDSGTSTFASFGNVDKNNNPVDCFENTSCTSSIQSGDILISPYDHIVMVDTISSDPFQIKPILNLSFEKMQSDYKSYMGLNKSTPSTYEISKTLNKSEILTENEKKFLLDVTAAVCNSEINYKLFQVSIIHSASNNKKIGIQREIATESMTGNLDSLLKNKGIATCIQQLNDLFSIQKPELVGLKPTWLKNHIKNSKNFGNSKILRHIQSRAGCQITPPVIPQSTCADCCDLNSTYEKMNETPGGKS